MGRKEGVRDLLRRDGDGKRRKWEMRDGKGERKGKENEGRRAACPSDKKPVPRDWQERLPLTI